MPNDSQMMVGEPTMLKFRCPQCGIDCNSQGRYISHLRFGHGVFLPETPPDVPYKAVSPQIEVSPRELTLAQEYFYDRQRDAVVPIMALGDDDGLAHAPAVRAPTHDHWQNYVPEKTVEMDGGAVLSVDPATGAAKGVKLARFDLVPMDSLTELANHYGIGERKYPSDEDGTPNWSKGMAWSKVTQAAMRHLALFIGGEDIDEETGQKHVIAVAWHMFALAHYMNTHTGTDDRWQS
jgi:hypothetical protein